MVAENYAFMKLSISGRRQVPIYSIYSWAFLGKRASGDYHIALPASQLLRVVQLLQHKMLPTSPNKTSYLNNISSCLESLAQSWWLHCSVILAATPTQHTSYSMGLLCPDPHRNRALTCGQSFSPQPLPNCLTPVWLQFFISIARKLIHLQNRQQHKVRKKPAGFSITVLQDCIWDHYGHHWLTKPDQSLTLTSDALFTSADKNKMSRKGEHLLSKKGH